MKFVKDIDDFITEKKNNGWSETQADRVRRRLGIFQEDMGETEHISEQSIDEWQKTLRERGLSDRTIKEYLMAVNQFLDYSGYSHCRKMHGRSLNLKDQRFGSLTAIEPCKTKRSKERSIIWKCQCICGKMIEVPANQLTSGQYTSCGCQKSERLKEANQYIDGTSLKMIFSDTVRKDNSSGYKGVYWKKDRWAVRIQYKGKRYYLGSYDNLNDAIKVRKDAEEKIREDARDNYGEK